MAHYRTRYVENWLKKLIGFSPIVGILGHRQVGKTTLTERIGGDYFTLDDKDTLAHATEKPTDFLNFISRKKNPAVLDECQYAPALFPAIKEHVRKDKKPGQFILTGSVRFTSRKAIRESLTGRIINVEVPPLGVSEILEINRPNFFSSLMSSDLTKTLKRQGTDLNQEIVRSLDKFPRLGGLPGVCFVRDEKIRNAKFEAQIETLLDRDLRLIVETTLPFVTLRRVLTELAGRIGEPLNTAEIQRRTRVSVNTLKRLLFAFEAMFLIQIVPSYDKAGQPLLFFMDSGEANHLATLTPEQEWSQTIFCQIKANTSSIENVAVPPIQITHFKTRGGTFIPLVLKAGAKSYGILPRTESMSMMSILSQAQSFLKSTKATGILILDKNIENVENISENIIIVSPQKILI